jgi:nitrogen regulatory protein P-II
MSGQFVEVQAVRVICDSVVGERVLKELKAFGAPGCTWWQAHGEGTVPEVGLTESFDVRRRIYFEVWCKPSVAEKIVEYCRGSRFRDVGMIAGLQPLWIHEDDAANFGES